MLRALMLTLAIILILVIGWHLIFPLMIGGTIALTAGIFSVMSGAIVAFCVAILLLFIFTGIGAIVLSVLVAVGAVLGIVFLPILFPIVFPLLILFLFISYFRRKKKIKVVDNSIDKN